MDPKHAPATLAWYPSATADSLPPLMLETDARLSCHHLERILDSIVARGRHCAVYRYSNTLAYKPVCRRRETTLMLLAEDVALPVVSRVGVVDHVSSKWYQKGAVMELGCPLDVTKIPPAERPSVAQQMVRLVTRLHEKGVIHGDIKPGKFVKTSNNCGLRLIGFSSARMADDSDLSLWPAEEPTLEYTAPNRAQNCGPPSFFDDYFALAASIWAVFAGENPMAGLFSSNEGHTPDVAKITDDDLFCTVVDVLKQGGLKLDGVHTASRRRALGLSRTASFPLSLFDADPDDLGQQDEEEAKPRFCPHCFEMAMADAGTRSEAAATQQHLVEDPEFCHLRLPNKHDLGSVSDYALEWLLGQEGAAAGYDYEGISQPTAPWPWPNLRVDTSTRHLEAEEPVWTGVSTATTAGATVVPAGRALFRDRSTTVVRAPVAAASDSDEGCQSVPRRRSCALSWAGSDRRGMSLPGTLSDRSGSSSEQSSEDGRDRTGTKNDGDPGLSAASSPPLTPMPPKLTLLHVSSSFDSVALSDDGGGSEKGAILREMAGSATE